MDIHTFIHPLKRWSHPMKLKKSPPLQWQMSTHTVVCVPEQQQVGPSREPSALALEGKLKKVGSRPVVFTVLSKLTDSLQHSALSSETDGDHRGLLLPWFSINLHWHSLFRNNLLKRRSVAKLFNTDYRCGAMGDTRQTC